jgi:Ca-activated chloride channel family protein
MIFSFLFVSAQKERKFIRQGNDNYDDSNYKNSEVSYRKAINKNKESFDAAFNIGDALYKQKKYEEANKQFTSLLSDGLSKDTKSKVYHNIGNSFLQKKKYKESIEAYKNALRNNPKDKETKYNLQYAQNKLKQQEQKQKD